MLHLIRVYNVFSDKTAGIKLQCYLCLKTDPDIYKNIQTEFGWKNLEALVLGNFSRFCCRLLTLFKINIFKKDFQEHLQSIKCFGPRSGPTLCRS